MSGDGSSAADTILVWDRIVRVGHWLLALAVLFAWLTRHRPGPWHEWIGYSSLAIIAVRLVWGWRGSGHARFSEFVRGPRETLSYARALVGGREPRTLGHNPLGGWMIVALLVTATIVGASGWLYTTDRFWGVEWVESVHRWCTNALWGLVGLHVAGVLYASLRHRENLVAAMLHGRKVVETLKGQRSLRSARARRGRTPERKNVCAAGVPSPTGHGPRTADVGTRRDHRQAYRLAARCDLPGAPDNPQLGRAGWDGTHIYVSPGRPSSPSVICGKAPQLSAPCSAVALQLTCVRGDCSNGPVHFVCQPREFIIAGHVHTGVVVAFTSSPVTDRV